MAVDAETENIEVHETEEYIAGELHKVRTTITTNVTEEVVNGEERTDDAVKADNIYENTSFADHLVCQCQTPSGNKAYCLIMDNHDGTYTVDINASEPGVHTVDVELHGRKIPGSPFLVRIVQAADKKKVVLYGNGLNSGLLDDFEGVFHVDTKGAGPGDLKVRIHGPKDGFNVVMDHGHFDNRLVNIDYHPTLPGIYTINVYWSGEHVVGSPCEVFIAPESDILRSWMNDPENIREKEGLTDKY